MNNQHFGDINDFYKYAILWILQREGESKKTKLLVVWMITNNENKKNKKDNLKYLRDENSKLGKKLRECDEELKKFFDLLRKKLIDHKPEEIDVSLIEDPNLFPRTHFMREPELDKNSLNRYVWFEELIKNAEGNDLVFLDPDTGIVTKSTKYEYLYKYVQWSEILKLWENGHSLLIYQHCPIGEEKAKFKERIENSFEEKFLQKTSRRPLFIKMIKGEDSTAYFILVAQKEHKWLETAIENIRNKKVFEVTDLSIKKSE